ncbi:hypothetical protein DYB31_009945, partial [Aphanomyces astaci]
MSDSEGDNSPVISGSEEETVKTKKRKQSSKDGKSSKKAKKSSRVMDEDSDDGGTPKSKFVDDEASESGDDDDDDKVIDSSEEELDEDADTYEKDGFLVADDEDDEEEEEQPRRRRKKKDKKGTTKRSRLRHGRDDRDELDRDDLDLIQENLGKKPARAYSDDDESNSDDDESNSDDEDARKKKKAKGKQTLDKGSSHDLFGSDDDDEDDDAGGSSRGKRRGGPSDQYMDEQDYNSEDEFIVSDDDDGGGGPRRRRTKRPGSGRQSANNLPQGPSLDQLDEAEELFGDAEAFLEATRGGAAPTAASVDPDSEKKAMLLDKYEPSVLKEFHMTTSDSAVRERDIPERMQHLFKQRPTFPDSEERAEEAEWMVDAVLRKLERRPRKDMHAPPPTFHRSNVVTAIEHVLRFYHVEKLEPAYVQRYCKEYWK